jgi:acyl-CoA synthetase (AMP-forming)/AMP-acid ligase II
LITEEALSGSVIRWSVHKWLLSEDGSVLDAAFDTPKTQRLTNDLPVVNPFSEARVIFTSGSSGSPKAAVYSHRQRWMAALVLRSVLPYRPDARSGIALMTPYVHGASALARAYLDCGSRVEIMNGIDSERLKVGLQGRIFDAIFAPPSVLGKLAELFEGKRFDHIRCIFTGTQPLARGIYKRAAAIFGPCIRITYGKTENLNPITVLEPDEVDSIYQDADASAGTCVGYPGPGVELRLTGAGEVELRSQHQFCGYLTVSGFQRHAANVWHATGDLGAFDEEGRLWLKGRNTDIINTGGYMVSPDEVESTLSTAQGVRELCVFGIPSEYWTEVSVCVYVAASDASTVGSASCIGLYAEAELRAAAEQLTKYKRPRIFVSVDALAKTPAGKVDRRENRRGLLAAHTLKDGAYPSLAARLVE